MSGMAVENPLMEMFGDDVTQFVSFDDGTINPTVGDLKPLNPDAPQVIGPNGVFGKCLAAGGVSFGLDRSGRETFDTTVPGTVLCWVRSELVPSKAKLEPAMLFFLAQSKDAKRKLYGMKRGGAKWGWGPTEIFYEYFDQEGKRTTCHATRCAPMEKWIPGEWRLMAMTWTPEMIGFSLDGGPFVHATYAQSLGAFDGRFSWMAPSVATPSGKRLFSVDDCAILNHALSDADIRCYYETALALRTGKPNPHPSFSKGRRQRSVADFLGFRFAYYPSHNCMHVRISAAPLMRKTPSNGVFDLIVRTAAGKDLKRCSLTVDKEGLYEEILDVPDLANETRASGCPDYEMVLEAPDVPGCRIVRPFRRSVFDWEGTKLGRSDAIPEPFTPIEVKRTAAGDLAVGTRCKWHQVDGLGLWKNMRVKMTKEEYGAESAPEDAFGVMAGPMRLEATKTGKTVPIVGRGLDLRAHSQARAESRATFEGGPLRGRSEAVWDVDGMMTWTLTLESGEVDALRLVIPLDGKEATLMHACTDGVRINYAGVIPAGVGCVWTGRKARRNALMGDYVPYLWLGGPVAGLSVFGDNDKGWVTGAASCQEIVRKTDGTLEIVLNLISRPTHIDSPRTIRIGFLATPVKPMEPNWRGQEFGTLIGSCYAWGAHVTALDFQTFDPTDAFWKKMAEARKTGKADRDFVESYIASAPQEDDPGTKRNADYRQKLRLEYRSGLHKAACAKDSPIVFYTNGRGIATGVEPGRTFLDEWMIGQFQVRQESAFSGAAYSMDPVPSLIDYEMSCFRRMLDSGACDRLYWDDTFLTPNFSPVGTDAYAKSDGIQPSCGIFRMREQIRRAAVMQKELGYDARHNWVHMTDAAMSPIIAFAGISYDLEDAHDATSLQQRYSRERLLAGSLGRQFGVHVATMAYYGGDKEKKAAIERSNIGVSLTFELWWRRGPQSYHDLYARIRKWGYGDPATKVWNWWDGERYPVAVKGIESSSVAMAKDGKALAIVSNWGADETAGISFDAAKLGLSSAVEAADFETGERLALDGASVSFPLKKGDFRIIELK